MSKQEVYTQYAHDVVSGKIIACQAIRMACQRYLDWFSRQDIYFDKEEVEKVMRFCSKLKHYEGKTAGQPFKMTPCQQWMVASIFGWKWRDSNLRVTNKVLIMVARKFGKSFFAAALALYMLIGDREPAAQVLNIANNKEQAKLLFKMEQVLAKQIDPTHRYLNVQRDRILFDKTNSYSRVLSADGDGLDGLSASTFITDEIHAYNTSELWDVLISSQGFRQQPLAIAITTAGFNLNGFLWQYYKTCKDILRGFKQDDTQFIAIYELDEGDAWQNENVWIKANPNLGVTVTKKYLKDQVQSAINNPALEVGVKTKNLNMFCQSKTIWIPDTYVQNVTYPVDLDVLRSEETDEALIAYGGVDIGATSDLTCFSILLPPSEERKNWPDKFVFKTWCLVPEVVFEESMNGELYKQWAANGDLIVTPGNITDLDYMIKQQKEVKTKTTLFQIGYDPWSSLVWAQKSTEEEMLIYPFAQNIGHFSNPTKMFEMLVRSGQCIIDNNAVVRWAIANTELKEDPNQNVKPMKFQGNRDNKIDPVVSMIEALGVWMEETGYMTSQSITVQEKDE